MRLYARTLYKHASLTGSSRAHLVSRAGRRGRERERISSSEDFSNFPSSRVLAVLQTRAIVALPQRYGSPNLIIYSSLVFNAGRNAVSDLKKEDKDKTEKESFAGRYRGEVITCRR